MQPRYTILMGALSAIIVVGGWEAAHLWSVRQRAAVAVAGVSPIPDLSRWPAELRQRILSESSGVGAAKDPIEPLARLAELYCANGFTAEAARALDSLRRLQPRMARWPYLEADMRLRIAQKDAAKGDLEAAVALDPTYAPAWLRLGESLREAGVNDRARECFERALGAAPSSVRAQCDLVSLDAQVGGGGGLPSRLGELERTHPEIKEVHEMQAEFLEAAHDQAGAARERRLASACELNMSTEDPWLDDLGAVCFDSSRMMVRAIELRREGRFPEVEKLLIRVEKLAPNEPANPLGWDLLSNFYLKTGRPEQALSTLRTAVSDFPDDPQMRLLLARLLCDEQQAAAAVPVAREAVARWPDQGDLRAALGRALRDSGDNLAGAQSLRDALRLDPTLTEAQYDLGTCLLELGDRAGAHTAFSRALAMRLNYPEALFAIGKIELEAGDFDSAEAHVSRLFTIDPDNAPARQLYAAWHLVKGQAAGQAGDLDEADRQFRAGLAMSPDLGPILKELGSLEARRGKWADASQFLEHYLQVEPTDPEGYLALGLALGKLGRTEDAMGAFRRGLEVAQHAGDQGRSDEFRRLLATRP